MIIDNIVGIIPARYKSSRLEGKPLLEICGKPMIYWVYQHTKAVSDINRVIIATDDQRIIDVCKKYDMDFVLSLYPHINGTSRAGEVAKSTEGEWFIIIQGDEPMVQSEDIQLVIDRMKKYPNRFGHIVTSLMTKITNPVDVVNTTVAKVVTSNTGKCLLISRSPIPYPKDNIEINYYRGVGVYGMSNTDLEFFCKTPRGKIESIEDSELLRFIDNDVPLYFVETKNISLSVDTLKDLEKVRKIMESQL